MTQKVLRATAKKKALRKGACSHSFLLIYGLKKGLHDKQGFLREQAVNIRNLRCKTCFLSGGVARPSQSDGLLRLSCLRDPELFCCLRSGEYIETEVLSIRDTEVLFLPDAFVYHTFVRTPSCSPCPPQHMARELKASTLVACLAMDADKAAIAAALQELGEDFDPDAGFAVVPLTECPHVTALPAREISMKARCSVCKEEEVWLCGSCGQVLCSRYKNKHMLAHAQEEGHSVGLSFSDLSFWCFKCNSYLDVYAIPQLHDLYRAAHLAKFGHEPPLPSISRTPAEDSGAASSSG